MLLCAIDPSFTKTGLAIVDIENKRIDFHAISPAGKNDSFTAMLSRANFIANYIIDSLDNKETIVILEEPLFSSIKASSLGILAGIVSSMLYNSKNIKEVYSIKPYYVANLNTPIAKKYNLTKKQASLYVVNLILDKLNKQGFTIKIHNPNKLNKDGTEKARKLSHDESEAFLILLVLLKHMKLMSEDMVEFLSNLNEKFDRNTHIEKVK